MGKAEQKIEHDEQIAEADFSPARLGKEVKIGLAVIAGLFVILVIVAGMKFFGGGSGGEQLAAEQPAEAAPLPEKSLASAAKPKHQRGDEQRTTFLPAKPRAEKQPLAKELDSRLEKWKQPPAKLESPQLPPPDDALAPSDPPAFLPDMPKPPAPKTRAPKSAAERPLHENENITPPPARLDRYSSEATSDAGFSFADGDSLPPPPKRHEPRHDLHDAPPPPSMPTSRYAAPPRREAPPMVRDEPHRQETTREPDTLISDGNRSRGGRTYIAAEGDTLFDIARYELGMASRWVEIFELNRAVLDEDVNYIKPGTKLLLPDDERSERLAEPPSRRQRR